MLCNISEISRGETRKKKFDFESGPKLSDLRGPKHNEKEEVSKRKLAAMTRIHRVSRTDINQRQI